MASAEGIDGQAEQHLLSQEMDVPAQSTDESLLTESQNWSFVSATGVGLRETVEDVMFPS